MKLNNKGWGTIEMLILSLGLFIALLIAIFFISRLYGSFGNAIGNRVYIDLENKLEESAKKYIETEEILVNGDYKITLYTLKTNGYIEELKDKNNESCNGYVMVSNLNGNVYYNGYILCNNYQTKNY